LSISMASSACIPLLPRSSRSMTRATWRSYTLWGRPTPHVRTSTRRTIWNQARRVSRARRMAG
jgi:hypothetical protein